MSAHEDEEEPTAEEAAVAAALARALERAPGGAPPGAVPEEALATAGLLRAAAPAPLPPERLAAAGARARAAVGRRRWWRRRWLLPALLVPAAAAAALVLLPMPMSRYAGAPVSGRSLPVPSRALLEAQARATRGNADLAALDRQMRDYRAEYLAAVAGGHTQ